MGGKWGKRMAEANTPQNLKTSWSQLDRIHTIICHSYFVLYLHVDAADFPGRSLELISSTNTSAHSVSVMKALGEDTCSLLSNFQFKEKLEGSPFKKQNSNRSSPFAYP